MTDLTDVSKGDLITSSRANLVKDFLQDAAHKINTLSLEVGSVEIIDSSGYVKPVRIIAPDSGGILFYASDGTTKIAELDESGNLLILGGVGNL